MKDQRIIKIIGTTLEKIGTHIKMRNEDKMKYHFFFKKKN